MILQTSAEPGDGIEGCVKSCTSDPNEQNRINSLRFTDVAQDKCSLSCMLKSFNLLKDNGDFDVDSFKQIAALKNETIDYEPITVVNINKPGFMTSTKMFVDKNRKALASILNHQEAI